MKSLTLVFFAFIVSLAVKGQEFGNEWINYDQTYYKFPVYEDGVYRITYQDFTAAGIPISLADPENIQIFANSQEVPLFINGVDDGVFNSSDYIELVGRKNDGAQEATLYNPAQQGNPDYSLFNDTIFYYVTISPGVSGLRYEIETDSNYDDYPGREYFWKKDEVVFKEAYHTQAQLLENPPINNPNFRVSIAEYSNGESYASTPMTLSNPDRQIVLNSSGIYRTGDVSARMTARMLGVSDLFGDGDDHHIQIKYGTQGYLAVNDRFNGYRAADYSFDVLNQYIGDSETQFNFAVVNSLGLSRDDQAIASVLFTFPHEMSVDGGTDFIFEYRQNLSQNKTLYSFTDVDGEAPRIFTLASTPHLVFLDEVSGEFKGILSNDVLSDTYDCAFVTDGDLKSIDPIIPAGQSGTFTDFSQSQIDSAFVIVTHSSLWESAEQYRIYKQGSLNTVMVDVEEIYDQFGYGVRKSGLAIRNFSAHLMNVWSNPPQYLFLLGKSISPTGSRNNADRYAQNLVPSLGHPASDNFITAPLTGNPLVPSLKTGRLSARSPEEVEWYLNKLVEHEAHEPAMWQKNVLHFGGGNSGGEQERMASYLATYGSIAADSSYGAEVHTFLKTSLAPIEINASEEVAHLIENEGVGLMTFFSHSSADGFDQSIDDPENYNWNGRYPFLLANGCYSGDVHGTNTSIMERYTILQEKGVMGFIASSVQGYENDLKIFSLNFYEQLSLTGYGKAVGSHVQASCALSAANTVLRKNLCYGMTLQGDPSVKIPSWPLPDLEIKAQNIYFTPEVITNEVDSFDVSVIVQNLARGTNQPVSVTVEHSAPEGIGDGVYTGEINGSLHTDTISFRIGLDPQYGVGLHSFNAYVDLPQNTIPEYNGNETINNQVLNKSLFVSNGGVIPIYPANNAVVGSPKVTLKAATGNPLAELKTYRIQIDTVDTFNSPYLQETKINQSGGVVEWTPNVVYPDSAVYFWRCTELTDEDLVWRNSSFQFIPKRQGWGQDHIFQFDYNSLSSMEIDRDERDFDFQSGTVTLQSNVLGNSVSNQNNVVLGTDEIEYGVCYSFPSIHVVVFDPVTFEAWGTRFGGENPENDFGNINDNAGGGCRARVEYFFIYRQNDPTQLEALANFLSSTDIPDGHFVLVYTSRYVDYANWPGTGLSEAFAQNGAELIGADGSADQVPFSMVFQKGNPDFVFEEYATQIDQIINLQVELPRSGSSGYFSSRQIGPALSWETASWKMRSVDVDQTADDSRIVISGVGTNGVKTELGQYTDNESEIVLDNILNGQDFPYLLLESYHADEVFQTPKQTDRWHVLFEPAPEAAIDPNTHYAFQSEELQAGEDGMLSIAIRNISDVDMDSLLVHYWIEDTERNRIDIVYPRQAPLLAGQTLIDTVYFDTRYLSGSNSLWVEVNPENPATGEYDQLEQEHFNNLIQIPFEVTVDNQNPILDVTFDGIHIINGEVVSPSAMIRIALKDENPFLIMDEPSDTALFKVFLAPPGGNLERYYFGNSTPEQSMTFIPAMDQKNRAKIDFQPGMKQDGKYRLLVQASDKSGNPSGNTDYQIEFEVINRSTITEVLNYPNPFSTSTQFVFTLTGSQVPDEFMIQIMTISGKVVKEITAEEFGPIRIGRNFSEYRWDGRDNYGDRLANGVYLYRVFARLNGENIDLNETEASQYFTKSFGKMVLFR